ncbi:unnamed protein product [Lepeophtheirus salmonis]|uniref:(salmon louse) hypothetical protein n=1 Tax=Lepeophtheirus salmonis TaxID=72036 RepID=A0A7R8CMU5_LEPSM|nr:unnamed protein product [Lepeophtheirus salmonis]CAF2868329.1 unnamed protein product [Lepeophtheirus salmonis]
MLYMSSNRVRVDREGLCEGSLKVQVLQLQAAEHLDESKVAEHADARMAEKQCFCVVPFSSWPPLSPDLNPLDYFVWSFGEHQFRSHIERILAADGSYIE